MRIDKQLKVLGIKAELSMAEIGRRLNKSPQAFNQKIKRGNFSIEDLENIAIVTGCSFSCAFILPTGERIEFGDEVK
jgi:transcriptional regulator with XRE-family HTH domain